MNNMSESPEHLTTPIIVFLHWKMKLNHYCPKYLCPNHIYIDNQYFICFKNIHLKDTPPLKKFTHINKKHPFIPF